MILRIWKHGEPILKKKTPVIEFDAVKKDLPRILRNMWDTMYAANGVGLAAPQIGLPLRMSVIDVKVEEKSDPLVLINPEIVGAEGTVAAEEGCLSIPGLYAKVKRYSKVRIRALDLHGEVWERTGTGMLARAFQHEVDHLNGKLFLDHLSLVERLRIAPILRELKKTWK
ncbi:MAG: peptide deformylase [Elusimicrobiota bacterium]